MKIASYIGLFVLLVLSGDRLVALGARHVVRHSRNQFVEMYEGKYRTDVLLLGNSRIDRNLSLEELRNCTGKTYLNLGLGGNHVLISEVLLRDYVERYGNPGLVLVELSQSIVKPENMGEIGIFSCFSTNVLALEKKIEPEYVAFQDVFKSLRFNDPAFWRLSAEVFRQPSSRLLNNTIPPEMDRKWQNGRRIEFPVLEQNLQALHRMCLYAQARQIPLRLVIGPYWKPFRQGISNYQAWRAALQAAAGQNRIYDYSDVYCDQAELFNDEMHLNAKGATCFTRKLIEDKVL